VWCRPVQSFRYSDAGIERMGKSLHKVSARAAKPWLDVGPLSRGGRLTVQAISALVQLLIRTTN
jgi:hypothetical protein